MSICDLIVVMDAGVVQQIGEPQQVYDDPENLFVAKFLGTPSVNLFRGNIRDGWLYIGEDACMAVRGLENRGVTVGIRPEGFIPSENGKLHCHLDRVEVMGRDVSIVCQNDAALGACVRAIVSAESAVVASQTVCFDLKENKVLLFDPDTGARLRICGD